MVLSRYRVGERRACQIEEGLQVREWKSYDFLCGSCETILNDTWDTKESKLLISEYEYVQRAAEYGCPFCTRIIAHVQGSRYFKYSPEVIAAFKADFYLELTLVVRHLDRDHSTHMRDASDDLASANLIQISAVRYEPWHYINLVDLISIDHSEQVKSLNSVNTGYSPSFRDQIKKWLNRCEMDHDECRVPSGLELPTRLLDLRDISKIGQIRVVDTKDLDSSCRENLRYLTLSHRWGTLIQPPKLTQNHHRYLALSELPRTFRDAVQMTQDLAVDFLWIDSLCIVQDEHVEKRKEIAGMHNIYQGASLNLVADAALDCESGLYPHKDEPRKVTAAKVEFELDLQAHDSPAKRQWLATRPYICTSFGRGTTSHRAWCVQERMLARRLVQFMDDQVLFQCKRMKVCELFPEDFPSDLPDDDSTIRLKMPNMIKEIGQELTTPEEDLEDDLGRDLWWKFVQLYTAASLTLAEDRVNAMKGILGHIFQDHPSLRAQYVSGIWRHRLPKSLFWRRSNKPSCAPRGRAPSWSWLSVETAIIAPIVTGEIVMKVLEIKELAVCPSHMITNPASIVLEGPIVKVKQSPSTNYNRTFSQVAQNEATTSVGIEIEIREWDEPLPEQRYQWIQHWDWNEDSVSVENFICIIVSFQESICIGLMIAPAATSNPEDPLYERIGVMYSWKDFSHGPEYGSWVKSLPRRRVTII